MTKGNTSLKPLNWDLRFGPLICAPVHETTKSAEPKWGRRQSNAKVPPKLRFFREERANMCHRMPPKRSSEVRSPLFVPNDNAAM